MVESPSKIHESSRANSMNEATQNSQEAAEVLEEILDSAATTPAPPEPLGMSEVLRIPMLRRLWYAQIISVFGDFLALFAVIGISPSSSTAPPSRSPASRSPTCCPSPSLASSPESSSTAGRSSPTMVSSDSIRAVLVLLLIFATEVWHFYAILAAISIVSSFFGPAQGVAIRSAVPLHGLRSANALMQQVMFGMRIVGPAIASFMSPLLEQKAVTLLDSASFVGSALIIASVPFLARLLPRQK